MARRRILRPPKGIDDLIFPICQKFLIQKHSADDIAKWVTQEIERRDLNVSFGRQQVYPAILEAIRLGFIIFRPPTHQNLGQRLADATGTPVEQIRVLNVQRPDDDDQLTSLNDYVTSVNDHLASVTAEVVLDLIKKRGRARGKEKGPIHLGLGAGFTTMHVARHLGKLLRSEVEIPGVSELVLHAMSSGFLVDKPESAPVSFFHFFTDSTIKIRYVGLFSEAMTPVRDYGSLKTYPATRESFEQADDIEIVITSLATVDDTYGLLNRFEKKFGITYPQGKQHVGDVQFRPFGARGPLDDDPDGFRAVTLFELQDYFRMTQKEGKDLVLVAGPQRNGKTKAAALIPLFAEATLRIWTHAVMDVNTALELAKALDVVPA